MTSARLRCARTRSPRRSAVGLELLRFRSERRNAAIGRIDDERSLPGGFAALVPVIRRTDTNAVPAEIRILFAGEKGTASRDARIAADGFRGVDFLLLLRERDFFLEFFLR